MSMLASGLLVDSLHAERCRHSGALDTTTNMCLEQVAGEVVLLTRTSGGNGYLQQEKDQRLICCQFEG